MPKTATNVSLRPGRLLLLAAAMCATVPRGRAQEPDKPPTLDKSKQQLPVTPAQPLTPPPVAPEEEAAYKAYMDAPAADVAKKAQLGEDFMAKYPQSRYSAIVLSTLTAAYFQMGQIEKMTVTGEKALAGTPNDVQVLAILAQTIPRTLSKDASLVTKQLDQAEVYARRVMDIMPTLPKPEGATDESFAGAKNRALAMAHSGLGLVFIHRQKFNDAVPELEQSVKLEPDSVNYFLLGFADEKTLHYDDAAAAFAKCAAIQGQLQAKCVARAEEAKKFALTQPSAPK